MAVLTLGFCAVPLIYSSCPRVDVECTPCRCKVHTRLDIKGLRRPTIIFYVARPGYFTVQPLHLSTQSARAYSKAGGGVFRGPAKDLKGAGED